MKLPPGHVAGMGVHKATAYGGFGQKMLEKMGWSKGQGLGKEKHGMREAIEVKKKEDNLGVGANTPGWKWDWKYWEDAYNTGLQNLSKSDKKRKRRKQSSSSSSSSSSDSDSSSSSSSSSESGSGTDSDSSESDDEHNARLAEACGVVFNRDGTAASASAAELKLAQELARGSKGPAGRFGGREGKMARIRQQEAEQAAAIQAKLGIQRTPSTGNLKDSSASEDTSAGKPRSKKRKQPEAAAAGASAAEDAFEATAVADKQRKKKSKREKQSSSTAADGSNVQQQAGSEEVGQQVGLGGKSRVVVVVDIKGAGPNVEAFKAFKPTPATGWWGCKMFASAGLLEGIDEEQQQRHRQRTTFDEDMQTRVYMEAHDAQRQGRRGLGKSTTLKVAGGNWQGKKVTFEQEAATDSPASAGEKPGTQQQLQQKAAGNAAISSSPSSGAEAAPTASEPEGSSGHDRQRKLKCSGKQGKVKWVKLAVTQLQEAPGGVLKWSKLWKQLKQAAEQQQAVVGDSCKDKALKKLQGCRQLQVTKKLVSLVA